MERTGSTANLNLRITLTNGLSNHLATLLEDGGDDILIANAEILHVERGRMTGICTHLRPLRLSGIAVCPLNKVTEFIDVCRHIGHRDSALLAAKAISISS